MLRSMYSGISGLKANQQKLDVIGNNIANVSTTSFKCQRIRFQDMLSQNVQEATGPGSQTGGTNPRQVGLGVQTAGIDTLTTTGNMQPTSRNLDAAIDGSGYFMVGKGTVPASNSTGVTVNSNSHEVTNANGMSIMYTRDGAFTLDDEGNLLTSDGYRVLGYALSTDSTTANPTYSVDYSKTGTPSMVNFVDADDSDNLKAGNSLVPLVIPDSVSSAAKDATTAQITGSQAIINTSGSTNLSTAVSGNDTDNKITITVNGTSFYLTKSDFSTLNDTSNANARRDIIAGATDDSGNALSTKATVSVDATNKLNIKSIAKGASSNITFTITAADAAETNAIQNYFGIMSGSNGTGEDAVAAGTPIKVKSFSIEKDGLVKAVLDDGTVSALGQIAMASFKNDGGLTKLGKNLYQNSANSGTAVLRSGIGDNANDNGKGYGDMLQGMLEMSNVDLAEQFTDMITASRAFQANGKIISTGDEILQDLINLKR